MDNTSIGCLISIVILIAMSAYFSATETAFSSVNLVRLKNSGSKQAKAAVFIAEHFDKALSTILIGNNIVNIASASLGTVVFTAWFEKNGVALSTVVMTILVLCFGEILPKSFAKENAESFALKSAPILKFLMTVFTPLAFVFLKLKNLFTRRTDEKQPSVTEEELKYIIDEIGDEGVLEDHEKELAQSALDFDETIVEEILVPRVDILAIEKNEAEQAVREKFETSGFSRLPVYEKNIDNIIGILHVREFYSCLLAGKKQRPILQSPIFMPKEMKISTVLKELQRTKNHMAIVSDQYGGTVGLVTMEDILEELVGEIWDEHDQVSEEIREVAENVYEVEGSANIYDVFEKLGLDEDDIDGKYYSVGGWILEQIERIPQKGETFQTEDLTITVQDIEEQRIKKVKIKVERKDKHEEE